MTHFFFAEAGPTANDIGTWLQVAAFVLSLATMVVLLVTMNAKQKREVSFAGEPVDKKEFDELVRRNTQEHDNLFKKIGGVERGVEERLRDEIRRSEESAKQSRANLHSELTAVREDVAGLNASQELMNQRMVQMDGKLDRVIEKSASK